MDSMIKFSNHPQGGEEWLAERRGLVTGSRFKDARDRLKSGAPSGKCNLYAMDVARERCGGKAGDVYVNSAMRFGTEQEPLARAAYERATGNIVFEAGFFSIDGAFGGSVDGLVDDDGVVEIKTMVSSDTLFTALVDGDISAYIDQCTGYLWMLNRQWVDLVLWAPDLADLGLAMKVIRIERDQAAIDALEADLIKFLAMVRENESKLRKAAQAANAGTLLEAA
jgi:exodeoxyribonuclease (lambda-induced)